MAPTTVIDAVSQPAQFSVHADAAHRHQLHGELAAGEDHHQQHFHELTIRRCRVGLSIVFTQPLLQNRGTYVNRLTLMTARSRLRMSEYNLRNQFMNMVSPRRTPTGTWSPRAKTCGGGKRRSDVPDEFLKLSAEAVGTGRAFAAGYLRAAAAVGAAPS